MKWNGHHMDMITYQPQPVGVYIQLCTSKPCPDLCSVSTWHLKVSRVLWGWHHVCDPAKAIFVYWSCDVFVNESHVRRMFESDKMSVYNSDITIVLHQKKWCSDKMTHDGLLQFEAAARNIQSFSGISLAYHLPPEVKQFAPEKWWDWKTISFLGSVSVTFSGDKLAGTNLRGGLDG